MPIKRLGPPTTARAAPSDQSDSGRDVLLPYVARQRLLIHRAKRSYEKYYPSKILFGQEARHVEDRKRPNHFAMLSDWLKKRNWDPENYLYVASLAFLDTMMPSPQELTRKSIVSLYMKLDYRNQSINRVTMLAGEAMKFIQEVLLKKRVIDTIEQEEFPALVQLIILEALKYAISDRPYRVELTQLAACQYLADRRVYDSIYVGFIPLAVQKATLALEEEILSHGVR